MNQKQKKRLAIAALFNSLKKSFKKNPLFNLVVFFIIGNIFSYIFIIAGHILNKKETIADFYIMTTAMWMTMYLFIYFRSDIVFEQNKKLISIVKKLLNSIYIIREANNRGVSLSNLEQGGLFSEVNKEINEMIGEQKEPEIKFVDKSMKTDKNIN